MHHLIQGLATVLTLLGCALIVLACSAAGNRLGPVDMHADADQDGLPDDLEHALGTSAWLHDTDGDGEPDQDELICGSSPTDPALTCIVAGTSARIEHAAVIRCDQKRHTE